MPPHSDIHRGRNNDALLPRPPRSSTTTTTLRLSGDRDTVTGGGGGDVAAEGEDVGVELAARVPGTHDARQDAVGHAADDLGQGIGA